MSINGSPMVDPRFAERVARIEAARARGPVTAPRKMHGSGLGYALSLVAALGVGVLMIFAARYARFHLTGMVPGSGALDPATLIMDVVMAFLAGIVLHQIFHFRRPEHTAAKTIGMIGGMFTMHIPVHAFPGLFEVLFSEFWVFQVLRLTDPTAIAVF